MIARPMFRALLLLSATIPTQALAQAGPPVPSPAAAPVDADIVVTGARLQAKKEIEAKRAIAVISDSDSWVCVAIRART